MDLLHVYDVSCTNGVLPTAPVEVQTIPGGLYVVSRVTIVIPAGHGGLTGIALGYGHQPVIPVNPGAYISGDDDVEHYDLGRNFPAGVAWSVFLCNSDIIGHVWETRWELDLIVSNESAPAATLTAADIVAAGQTALGA